MFLAWFDADRKKSVATKIAEAHERYVAKFGREPLVCLVNPADEIPDTAIALRPLTTIGRNCFWIGTDEDIEPEVPVIQPEPAPTRKRRARRQPAAPSAPAPVQETPAPIEALSDATTATNAVKAARSRKARPAVQAEPAARAAPPAPATPEPVPTRRRSRRERPAA